MKKNILFILLIILFLVSKAQVPGCNITTNVLMWNPQEVNYEHGDWTLVFEDDFNETVINTDKWYTCGDGLLRTHGNELQVYLDDNIEIHDGILHLVAKNQPGRYKTTTDMDDTTTAYFDYTSGWIQTKSDFLYGLFEIRCKIPNGRGFWPAFWLFGNNGEIDVFEFDCEYPNKCSTNVHLYRTSDRLTCQDRYTNGYSYADDYHVFSMEWSEFALTFRVDGQIIRSYYHYTTLLGRDIPDYANLPHHEWCNEKVLYPTKAQHVILNLAIPCGDDCDWSGLPPNNTTPFPSSFDIDYIRIYKRTNPTRDVEICAQNHDKGDYYTGRNITIGGCPLTLDSNQTLMVVATSSVTVLPDFEISNGAVFDAMIGGIQRETSSIRENRGDLDSIIDRGSPYDPTDNSASDIIRVFPNPSSGNITISLTQPLYSYSSIRIVDIRGNTVYIMNDFKNNKTNLTSLQKGVYYIIVEMNTKSCVAKLIVQ